VKILNFFGKFLGKNLGKISERILVKKEEAIRLKGRPRKKLEMASTRPQGPKFFLLTIFLKFIFNLQTK